jgi:putative spermidine/putrescine transport system permease protein
MTAESPSISVTAFTETVAETDDPAPSGAGSRLARVREELSAWAGLIPFFTFLGLFLLVPTVSVFLKALSETEQSDVPAMREAVSGPFRGYFGESLRLSAVTAVLGGAIGTLLALVVVRLQRPRWLRTAVTAFSGVAANMGGIILAFAFIAALGTQGLATKIIKTTGLELPTGFITGFWGLVTVYLFFQIPYMFLVMLPAVDGLKPAWREAVANLGGTAITYWRRVGIPVLTPAVLGGTLLLFANAFAAYATAYSLSTGAASLVSVQIRFFLQGNTITGKANLGYALAAWMVVLMLVTIAVYLLLRRRAERWQR